jgi:multiple sugar transport system permease protein
MNVDSRSAGPPSPNPLNRSRAIVHLPLACLALLYLTPLVWLCASSLEPREQVGKVPPEWLPRQYHVEIAGQDIRVTPPQRVGRAKVRVRPLFGERRGQDILIDPQNYREGVATIPIADGDRFVERDFVAQLIQRIAADDVYVREWHVSKYTRARSRQFWVHPGQVRVEIEPVWGNYAEAVRALTAGEKEKALPLGTLLGHTRWPWTPRLAEDRTITGLTYLSNTLLVAVLAVLGTVLSSALVAYGLSRIKWKGRDTLFTITLSTMMVPFPVLMIPLYALFRNLGWIGTLLPLWVPAYFGSAFNIFLLRQFFLTIPQELSEAACIDGCSEFGIFWRIVLPLSRPALAVVALFTFLFSWNDFLGPLIFLNEPDTFTMALGLQQYQSQSGGSEWHLLMGASVLLILPIIVLFFLAQRTFIQGIATTGIKG